MEYKVIIFDNDGVLMNPPQMFSEFFSEKYLIPLEEVTPFFIGPLQICMTGEKDLKEELVPWLKKWNFEGNVDDFLSMWFNSENFVDENIVTIINKYKELGLKVCLATNHEKYRVEWMKEVLDFNSLFDNVFSSSYFGIKKKNNIFFEKLLSDLNVEPKEILYFDDEQENIDSAKSVGINAILYEGVKSLNIV